MYNKHLKIMLLAFVMVFIVYFSATGVFAQSSSYLDTIYQAVDGTTDAFSQETSNLAAAGEDTDNTVVINTDDPNAKITVGDEPATDSKTDTTADKDTSTKADTNTSIDADLAHVNLVLADMTRILIGMNMGVPISSKSFTLIDMGNGSNTSTDTGSSTSTDTGSDTSTSSSTDTGSNTNTSTGTNTSVDVSVSELKTNIKDIYGLTCSDGSSSFSVRQLQILEEVLSSLPESFRKNTTEIIRDKERPADTNLGNDTLAYVIRPESKVHLLDRCINYTNEDIAELNKINNREMTEEELVESLEFQFRHTIVHEMTHCYVNRTGNGIDTKWYDKFWPDGKVTGTTPSEYAKTSYSEDLAESVAYYSLGGKIVKDANGKEQFQVTGYNIFMDMDRYNFIKENIMGGKEFLEKPYNGGSISI